MSTPATDEVTGELRELVGLRSRYVDELSDRMREFHRAVDLGSGVHTSDTHQNVAGDGDPGALPTARSFATVSIGKLAGLAYDGRHHVAEALARALVEGAKVSVGVSALSRFSCK